MPTPHTINQSRFFPQHPNSERRQEVSERRVSDVTSLHKLAEWNEDPF